MKIYFLSSRPCALMLGGVFFGMINRFERFAEIEPKDNVFAEFIPEGALPVGFFVTEKLRFSPPEQSPLCSGVLSVRPGSFSKTLPLLWDTAQNRAC